MKTASPTSKSAPPSIRERATSLAVPGATSQPRISMNTIEPIHVVPGYLVRRLHFICQKIMSEAIGESGLLPGHMGLMATLDTYPGIDQRTLATIIGSDPVTTGQLLDLLERRGFIERTIDPNDRRARRLALTAAGRATFRAMQPRAKGAIDSQIAPLAPSERKIFMRLLRKLVEAHLAPTLSAGDENDRSAQRPADRPRGRR